MPLASVVSSVVGTAAKNDNMEVAVVAQGRLSRIHIKRGMLKGHLLEVNWKKSAEMVDRRVSGREALDNKFSFTVPSDEYSLSNRCWSQSWLTKSSTLVSSRKPFWGV